MKYGLPYKGSKNLLAERILSFMPNAEHFFDLFCGGCAVSHAAMATRKFQHIHINDKNPMLPQLFLDALDGKFKNENRWISRDDFKRLKDVDPYVAVCWSFGNNMRDYLYGRDIEPLKRVLHYVLFFDDYHYSDELGLNLGFLKNIEDIPARYSAIKKHFKGDSSFRSQNYERFKRLTELESFNRFNRINALNFTPRLASVTSSIDDYSAVAIPDNSIVYCDIPYECTNTYVVGKAFDYDRFYRWCAEQICPVFVSSYSLPKDKFRCIAEMEHVRSYGDRGCKSIVERLFIPIHQEPPKRIVQGCLF